MTLVASDADCTARFEELHRELAADAHGAHSLAVTRCPCAHPAAASPLRNETLPSCRRYHPRDPMRNTLSILLVSTTLALLSACSSDVVLCARSSGGRGRDGGSSGAERYERHERHERVERHGRHAHEPGRRPCRGQPGRQLRRARRGAGRGHVAARPRRRQRHAGELHRASRRRAVAQGGVITFDCGPDPVTITLDQTAKVFNDTGPKIVIDGGGKVTLSGGGTVRILYHEHLRPGAGLDHLALPDQDHPQLTVQNLTFVDGNSSGRRDPDGGGAIFVRGGRFKVVNSRFFDNACDDTGPDVGGAAIRVFEPVRRTCPSTS